MGKESDDSHLRADPKHKEATVGLNILSEVNRSGSNGASPKIQEGLNALANMSEEDFEILVSKLKSRK